MAAARPSERSLGRPRPANRRGQKGLDDADTAAVAGADAQRNEAQRICGRTRSEYPDVSKPPCLTHGVLEFLKLVCVQAALAAIQARLVYSLYLKSKDLALVAQRLASWQDNRHGGAPLLDLSRNGGDYDHRRSGVEQVRRDHHSRTSTCLLGSPRIIEIDPVDVTAPRGRRSPGHAYRSDQSSSGQPSSPAASSSSAHSRRSSANAAN